MTAIQESLTRPESHSSRERADIPAGLELSQRRTRWLVLGVWLLSTCLGLHFSIRSTRVLPYWDECELVDYVAGVRPVTCAWLWEQHNEHRMPLLKLIMVGMGRLSAMDGILVTCVSTVLISASAGLMLVLVQSIRGRFSAWDCAIPVAFLNPAHGQTYSDPFQITWTLPVFLCCAAIYLGFRSSRRDEPWSLLAAGVALLMLPLCGAILLPTALLGAMTLAMAAHQRWRRGHHLQSFASGLLALGTAGLIAVYPIGLSIPEHVPGQDFSVGLKTLSATTKACSSLFGVPYVSEGYTYDILGKNHSLLLGGLLMLAVGCALAELGRAARQDPTKREMALWIAAPLAGIVGTALLLGYGRAWSPVATRYTIIFVPAVPLLLASIDALPKRSLARLATLGVCFLVFFAAPKNYRWGKQLAAEHRAQNRQVVAELADSDSMVAFVARIPKIYPDADRASALVRTLADHRLSLFHKHVPPASWQDQDNEAVMAERPETKTRR